MGKLFLLFVIMPIMEIAVLIHVGDIIGGWNTVLLVILSAMIGAYLVKREGVATLAQAQVKIAQGQVPAEEIGSGLLLLIAGVLLVTPGFITDIFGLLLTLPTTRRYLASHVVKMVNVQGGGFTHAGFSQTGYRQYNSSGQYTPDKDDIIEGEFSDLDNDTKSSQSTDSTAPKRLD
ncbi:FxsA family protein [Alteromonas sp. LMIT006]|uniref:FxsA family protein n=1 Tax=Alteromonadaceae TaxID=72275 RepID=UPI0020CA6808|nr:FxsA family protein [Alteromonas sp. LMIT006]UTP73068.1 FxsA family protein [Alteromonas sp. LMIT006]